MKSDVFGDEMCNDEMTELWFKEKDCDCLIGVELHLLVHSFIHSFEFKIVENVHSCIVMH